MQLNIHIHIITNSRTLYVFLISISKKTKLQNIYNAHFQTEKFRIKEMLNQGHI